MRKKWCSFMVMVGILVVSLGMSLSTAGATIYYVSSSAGNDFNPGTQAQPFKTISKVNTLNLQPGDQVLFMCGDIWRADPLKITKTGTSTAPITFGSYPAGCTNKPIFSGTQPITGWTVYSGNIYVADLSTGANAGKFPYGINQLSKDGQRLPFGRWPNLNSNSNGGYSTVDGQPSSTQITDNELPTGDWTGAMIHIKTQRWNLYNRKVTGTSSKTLTLDTGTTCSGGCVGWGYFLNNHLNTLDQDGEWYYDDATNRVYLYSTSGTTDNFEGAVILVNNYYTTSSPIPDGAIMVGDWSAPTVAYVIIENLELKQWFNHGIGTPAGILNDVYHHITIRNLTIRNVEATGIQLQTGGSHSYQGGQYMELTNNVIDGANHFGIAAYSTDSTIQDNQIKNIGLIPNLGYYGLGCGITDVSCEENGDAIRIRHGQLPYSGQNNTIRYNRIEEVGLCGIDVFSPSNTIAYNYIKRSLVSKADGGGIRIWGNNTSLATSEVSNVAARYNIIVDSIGNVDGVKSVYQQLFGMGITIDNYAKNIETTGNTVINTSLIGILYNHATGQASNNTVYNASSGTTFTGSFETLSPETQVTSQNNILYALSSYAWTLYQAYSGTLVASDYNYFFHPYKNNNIAYGTGPVTETTLSGWQAYSGKDAHSKKNWFTLSSGAPANSVIFYNDTKVPKTFNLGGIVYQDVDQNAVSGSLILQPFTSKILIYTGALLPPATLITPSGTTTTTTPTYIWNAVTGATWYYLWVNGPSGSPVIQQWYTAAQANCASGAGTCSVTPSTTLANGTHTWWIQTYASAGYGPWSSGLSFTVSGGVPPAATLVAPSGTSCDTTPTYIWNAVSSATWYYLWVNGPSGSVVKQWYTAAQAHCASGTGTCAVAPATTLASGTHTWWVQTWNSAGYGPWSAGKSFTVTPGSVPGAVTLIAPSGSTTNPPPYYWWYEDSCATWYYLWVNGPSGNVIKQWYTSAQANCNGTWCWVTNATTLPTGTNTWWVQTWNSAGYGPWSSGLTFTVGASGSQVTGAVVTVRKQGTGSGTIQFNEQVCGPACAELTLPYTDGARFALQVIPAADSRFVGWQTADGEVVKGTIFYARPGETVLAVFEQQP
jgi:hypothetical protein